MSQFTENVAKYGSRAISFSTVKEGDLPLLRFSNLTCMQQITQKWFA